MGFDVVLWPAFATAGLFATDLAVTAAFFVAACLAAGFVTAGFDGADAFMVARATEPLPVGCVLAPFDVFGAFALAAGFTTAAFERPAAAPTLVWPAGFAAFGVADPALGAPLFFGGVRPAVAAVLVVFLFFCTIARASLVARARYRMLLAQPILGAC